MKVVIIGTGNVSIVLGRKIQAAGHEIMQVVGRNFEKANRVATQLNTSSAYNLRYINLSADIYIVAVSDSAIENVASQLRLKDKIVVHTAAAVSKDVLRECADNFGIIYPVQTLSEAVQYLPEIPVLIDGNNELTKTTLRAFAGSWAETVRPANDEERLKLHVAAVIVNNFSNHLFALAEQYCREEHLNFNLLHPLIKETVEKIKVAIPSSVQTGPAVRKEKETISQHLDLLNDYPLLKEVYETLTESIFKFSDDNKSLRPPKTISDSSLNTKATK